MWYCRCSLLPYMFSVLDIPLTGCACLPTRSIPLFLTGPGVLSWRVSAPSWLVCGGGRDCDALIATAELAWK